MNVILFGPPGAGKGTQAGIITKTFNLHKISTGDLLRKEIKKNTNLGIKVKSIINEGSFVSDDIINNLIINVLSDKKFYNRLVFDGYPRNLNQAINLDNLLVKYKQKVSCVLNLKVEKELLIKRILGRQTCTKCDFIFNKFFNPSTKENHDCDMRFLHKRADDNEETARNRFETYSKETFPVLKYYQNQKLLYEIDGTSHIHEINKEIRRIIHSLEA